ncbi:MAG: hypothetical protein A3D28_04615 [Omnitrophica bacterium RIFCSPHIGHO2_02_FULL_63_14]|nr:MAG: hypothetical protein A3D28_04615 [Omnitrophica bacterium RIFCSPHIGHO2_02_FULL_63_14]
MASEVKNPARKLFFGLFVFPLLIAVGMAVLLCSVVLLTSERQTPEALMASVKSGAPGKRWQKAYELSNELNTRGAGDTLRSEALRGEIISVLEAADRYDARTRGYMALALARFAPKAHPPPAGDPAVEALKRALEDKSPDVRLYALWSLGALGAREAAPAVVAFLKSEDPALRKTAAYVLGVAGDKESGVHLKGLLSDPVADVRWNAALALARMGDASGAGVLAGMLDRRTLEKERMSAPQIEGAMINAIRGLARLGDKDSTETLKKLSQNEPNLKVRQAALEALK